MSYEAWTGFYKCPNLKRKATQHWFYDSKPERIRCYCPICNGAVTSELQSALKLAVIGPVAEIWAKRRERAKERANNRPGKPKQG